ncbi:transcriptional regulator [Acidovorax sp. Root275]|uniref:helix-turn-helix transcriptional regulator n=2 Tax=unclassified Acidovorax TaxID=2684926 RepID=UPI0006F5DFE1|nr:MULTISPECIES: helix-turn-helix transcriptional regulator [unclassified Acidovorax]KQW32831.1 transcriptional regulator [Acidovorax sp. Root402]KRD46727.1 transcriptional regulator [Acidovorax sp. Root275]
MLVPSNYSLLQLHLLLQLGNKLRRLRESYGLSTVEMASRVGISRGTLRAVEAGDPTPSMGTYLKAISALGILGDFALLADDAMRLVTSNTAATGASSDAPLARIVVSADPTRHRIQDLQSLALHEEAVRCVRADPALLQQAQAVLQKWLNAGDQRSATLWVEWKDILEHRKWRKALGRTHRAQELRQASPMTAVLPPDVRKRILQEVRDLKEGVVLEIAGRAHQ